MSRKTYTLAMCFLLAGSVPTPAQVPTSRPTSRPSYEQMLMRMRYEGRYTEADLARPASEVVQEFLQSDDRRLLEMQVNLLRRKVLKGEQLDQIIKAAEDPSNSALRVYCWQVLFDSGAPAAHAYLEKTFSQKTDEGSLLAFLKEAELTSVSAVPLVIRIFETNSSKLMRDEIMRMASEAPRQPSSGYADHQRFEAARVALLSWLLQHADSDEDKQKLLTGTSVPTAIAEDARVALRSIKSAEARSLIYKRLLRYAQDPWVTYLLTDEKDPRIQAEVIRRVREDMELGTERGAWGVPQSLRAAASSADPAVKTEIQKLVEVARKKGIEQVFAQLKQSASYRLQHRDMGVPMSDPRSQRPVEAEVDDTIRRLQGQFGELPEEAELRQRLKTELESYRRQVEQAASRPG